MHSEVHLFIIWDSGQLKRAEIIADIRQKFEIIDILNIKWDSDHFAQNLSRFYNQHFLPGPHKEVECGKGPFTLVILRDRSPLYEMRLTSRGQQIVNATMHDAKTLYRSWIGYGCKVHGTNNPQETRHDIFLLTGKPYAFYEDLSPIRDAVPDTVIDQNLTGCVQWQSLATLFQMLNETVDYVVLRNFAGMPQNYYSPQHGDIDLLVKDRERAAFLCNATAVFSEKHRVHYKININHQSIRFDLRFVGDNYYDAD